MCTKLESLISFSSKQYWPSLLSVASDNNVSIKTNLMNEIFLHWRFSKFIKLWMVELWQLMKLLLDSSSKNFKLTSFYYNFFLCYNWMLLLASNKKNKRKYCITFFFIFSPNCLRTFLKCFFFLIFFLFIIYIFLEEGKLVIELSAFRYDLYQLILCNYYYGKCWYYVKQIFGVCKCF